MGKLIAWNGVCLPGSTLLETIVASVIFLSVFAVSLETMSRMVASPRDTGIMVEVDHRLNECFRKYSSPLYTAGEYEQKYSWGTIYIALSRYKEYDRLRHISLRAVVVDSRRTIGFDHVIMLDDE